MNISNPIIEAIELISKYNVDQVKSDLTVTCKIQSYDEEKHRYRVKYNTSSFYVTSENSDAEYDIDSWVYVRVPNGEFSSSGKVITGRYEAEEKKSVSSITSLFEFTPVISLQTKQLINGTTIQVEELTNTVNSKTIEKDIIVAPEAKKKWFKSEMDEINTIAFTFEIVMENFPATYNQIGKDYAIIAEIDYEGLDKPITCSVLSSDFIGNPFGLVLEGAQQRFLFDCSYLDDKNESQHLDIDKIKKYSFTFKSTALTDQSVEEENAEISIRNCNLAFGYRKANIQNKNECLIDLNEWEKDASLTFDKKEKIWQYEYVNNGKIKNQPLYLQFYNQGNAYNYQFPNLKDCTIYWCKYVENYKNPTSLDITQAGENWKTLQAGAADEADSYVYTNLEINQSVLNTKIKVVVLDKNKKILKTSNILTFERKSYTSDNLKVEENGIILNLLDSTGVFFDYNQTTKAREAASSREFSISVKYKDDVEWASKEQKVTWSFPAYLSMLEPVSKDWKLNSATNMYELVKTTKNSADQTIKISRKKNFNAQYINNTIKCSVVRGKETKTGTITPIFGLGSVTGTGWACNIVPEKPFVTIGDTIPFSINIQVLNSEQQDYTNNLSDEDVEWSWMTDGLSTSEKETLLEQNNALFYVLSGRQELKAKDVITGKKITIRSFPTSVESKKPVNLVKKGNFAILRVKVKIGSTYLIDYWPVPFAKTGYAGLEGASEFIYDSNGTNPSPKTVQYSLLNEDYTVKTDVNMSYQVIGGPELEPEAFTPVVEINEQKEKIIKLGYYKLINPSVFARQYGSVIVTTSNSQDSIEVIWAQPTYQQKNYYGIKEINSWDGKIHLGSDTIGDKFLAAPMIFSGRFEGNTRQFTGITMGTVTTMGDGLFGFSRGTNTFGLKTDGSFYFGEGGMEGGAIVYNAAASGDKFSINVKNFNLVTANHNLLLNSSGSVSTDIKYPDATSESKKVYFALGNKLYFTNEGSLIIGQWLVDTKSFYWRANPNTKQGTSGFILNPSVKATLAFWIYNNTNNSFIPTGSFGSCNFGIKDDGYFFSHGGCEIFADDTTVYDKKISIKCSGDGVDLYAKENKITMWQSGTTNKSPAINIASVNGSIQLLANKNKIVLQDSNVYITSSNPGISLYSLNGYIKLYSGQKAKILVGDDYDDVVITCANDLQIQIGTSKSQSLTEYIQSVVKSM